MSQSYPFDVKNLPEDLQALVDTDSVKLEKTIENRLSQDDLHPEVIVAYAWSFHDNTAALLYWEDENFEDKCNQVLDRLEDVLRSPQLTNSDAVDKLFSSLVTDSKVAAQSRDELL